MLVNCIAQWAKRQPEKTAVIWNDVALSYLSYSNAIRATCAFLQRENLPEGRLAIVFVHGLLSAWIITLALRALGLNTISVRSMEQAQTLRIGDVACIIVAQAELAAIKLSNHVFDAAKVVTVPASILSGKDENHLPFLGQIRPPFGAHILYTSGTTGTYKKVLMRGEFEEARNRARAQFLSVSNDTVYHGTNFALWTSIGFKTPSAVWYRGGCVVLDQRNDQFERFFSNRITFAMFLPYRLKQFLRTRGPAACPVDGFTVAVGGGVLSIDIADHCIRALTNTLTLQYSSTEINSVRMSSRFRTKDDLHWLMPTNMNCFQVIDENGRECSTGQEGQLRITLSEFDCHEYLDDHEASAKAFQEGYFYPGDLAVKRDDGRIRILGRTADVVILNGQKLATAPIEQAIQRYLGVDEVCIFSGLTKQGHEEVVVALQSDKLIQRSQFETAAREFVPTEKVRFTVLKEFPRTDTGTKKTKRALLKKLLFDEIKGN